MTSPIRRHVFRLRKELERASTSILFGTMILLLLLGFSRIYTVEQSLQHEQTMLAQQQHAACVSRNQSRALTNTVTLVPLRSSLTYLANLVLQAAKKETGARREAAEVFAHRYLHYAAAVKPYSHLDCGSS